MTSLHRLARLLPCLLGAVAAASGCPALPPDELTLEFPPTGTIVGEVFAEDGAQRVSIGGALVEIYGTSARVESRQDRQFVLPGIRLGEYRLRITDPAGDRFTETTVEVQTRNQTVIVAPEDTIVRPAARVLGSVAVADPADTVVFLVGGTSAQVSPVGDDGTFVLGRLPAGRVQIGASKPGFAPALREIDVVPGENTLGAPFELAISSVNTLRLAGRVELDGRTDFSGVAITLNDGVAVAVTAADGSYTFEGLAPGAYDLRAVLPGFRTVSLPAVVLTEDGQALGLVPVFMSQGQDDQIIEFPDGGEGEGEGEGEAAPVTVDVVFPAPNDAFPGGAPVVLAASVDNAADGDVIWSLADQIGGNAVDFDTRGPTIVADLPLVDRETFFTVSVRAADGAAIVDDSVIIRVLPPIQAVVQAEASVLGVGLPDSEPLIENGVVIGERLTVEEGHPADVRPALGLRAIWTDGQGGAFQDVLPVAELPVGTHRFDGAITTADGQQGRVVVEVVVSPLTFVVTVTDPNDTDAYFVDTGLPLRARVTHGWQTSFLSQSVSWRLPSGQLVGTGLASSAQGVAPGIDVVTVEVVDLAGNRRVLSVPFELGVVEFTASFNAPVNAIVQEGTPQRVNVGFTHNRLSDDERAAAFVQVRSSLDGLLTMDGGAAQFPPATDVTISTLSAGRHTLTAQVFAGGRVAQTTTTIDVQTRFVSSNLNAPVGDLVAIPGEPVAMAVTASGGNGAIPTVRWFFDGVEFPATWPGYGTDPTATARRTLNFGTFDPDTFPFNDTRNSQLIWSDGPHRIEVSIAADDLDPGLGCVNLGVRAQCLGFNVQVARQVRVINSNITLTAGQTDVFEGVVRLQAQYTVNGGTLVMLPGARLLVDMRQVANPALQDSTSNRRITVSAGTLRVGQPGNVTPVVIETLKSFAVTNKWEGISASSTNVKTVTFDNVVIRDANAAVNFGFQDMNTDERDLALRDVVFENCNRAIDAECPSALDRITVRGGGNAAVFLRFDNACPGEVAYDGLTVTGVIDDAVLLDSPTARVGIQWSNVVVSSTRSQIRVVGGNADLTLQGATLTNAVSNSSSAGALDLESSGNIVVRDSTFVGGQAILTEGTSGARSIDVRRSLFSNLTRALRVQSQLSSRTYRFHGNRFEGVSLIADCQASENDFIEMEGNFIGAFTGNTAGRAVKSVPAGTVPTLIAAVNDRLDSRTSGLRARVRLDNPLPTNVIPRAIIDEPRESDAWNTRQCIPFVARAIDPDVDVDADCEFRISAPGASADTAEAVVLDENGCLTNAVDGTFDTHLVCFGVVDTVHTSRLLIDSTRFSGPVHPAGDTWSGQLLVDGDVVVPEGTTLTLAADADIRFAVGDRSAHDRPVNVTSTAETQRIRGSANRVDFFVDGSVVAIDTDGAPIALRAEVGSAADQWSGFIVGPGAVIDLNGVLVDSTVATVSSSFELNAAAAPSIALHNVQVDNTSFISTGVCATDVDGLTVGTVKKVADCGLAAGANWNGVDIDNVQSPGSEWLRIDDLSGSVAPGMALSNWVAIGNPSARGIVLVMVSGTGRADIANVDITNLDGILQLQGASQVADIQGLRAENFLTLIRASNDDIISLADSETIRGDFIINGFFPRLTVLRTRITDVGTAFRETAVRNIAELTVNGSEFLRVGNAFDFSQTTSGAGASEFDLTGNNFIGTTNRIVRMTGSQINSLVTRLRLDGSFMGSGDRTTFLPLIDDQRTDSPADTNDDNVGRTSFAGFATAPLALSLP